MDNPNVNIASFDCRLYDLRAFGNRSTTPETFFSQEDSMVLRVRVEFSGAGALALVPLKPLIQVDFYAKRFGHTTELELGRVSLETQPKQLVYEPTLTLEEGLGHPVSDVYKLSALVRIGAAGHPSLITGLVEGLILETYDA